MNKIRGYKQHRKLINHMGITTEEPIVIGSFQFTFAYFLRKVLTDRQRYTVNKIIIILKKKQQQKQLQR